MSESMGQLSLVFELMSQARKLNPQGNILMSPLSISIGMLSLAFGCKGNSRTQIGTLLNAETSIVTDADLVTTSSALPKGNEVLKLANGLFLEKNFDLDETYLGNVEKAEMEVETRRYNFKEESGSALVDINQWVENATNSKIKNLLDAQAIDECTKLVIINAIHFKSHWKEVFKEKATVKIPFYLKENESRLVDMMCLKSRFNVIDIEELDCRCIEIPYSQDAISCFILLPNKIDGLAQVEDNITAPMLGRILDEMNSGYSQKLTLKLPKFKLEFSLDLKTALINSGVEDVFDKFKADLSGFCSTPTTDRLYVSKAIHKAVMEVNEEGTEAAAATAFVAVTYSAYFPPTEFTIDHPFIIMIMEKNLKNVLFWGSIKDIET